MKINGIDINTYGAKLVSRSLESAETIVDNEWSEKSLVPFIDNNPEYKYKKLRVGIEFKGNFATTNLNKSKLLKEITNCVITEIGLGTNTLTGFLVAHAVKVENGFYQVIEYELLVIEEMLEISNVGTMTNGVFKFTNLGTGTTPVTLEITTTASGNCTMKINEATSYEQVFILNNMTANIARKISVSSGIFEGTTNKFGDTIFKEFPKFTPGENSIKIEPTTATVKATYKPRII